MAGQSESGLCQCNEFIMNPSPTSDTSAQPRDLSLDDNGLKCLASNGKPCLFPFKSSGKVEKFQRLRRSLILLNDFSGVYILHEYVIFIGL